MTLIDRQLASSGARLPFGLITAALIIAALYFGRDLLVPLALAILIGFVLEPVVARLRKLRLPRALAVSVVLLVTLALLAAFALFTATQLQSIGRELPRYQFNMATKARDLFETMNRPGLVDDASRVIARIQIELEKSQRKQEAREQQQNRSLSNASSDAPVRVEVIEPTPSSFRRLADGAERFGPPLATLGIVFIFVALILLDRGDLRDRAVRLLGGSLHRTTDALDEAAARISRYLTMQLVVNVTYGVPMAIGLWLIGVPGALLWGGVATVLRFVPYVGPVLAAIPPLVLAFAVDPGWSMLLWALGMIIVLELVSNNLVEPWLYGSSTGLSVLSLLMAATFWTAIWGAAGLILSTPLTVCLLVLGRHLPQLQFFDVLLGSDRALDAPTRLYQRLLSGDIDESVELATEYAEEHDTQTFYDQVAMPVLRLASEHHSTVATAEHRLRVMTGMSEVIEELRERDPGQPSERGFRITCLGGRWELDTLAADIIAHALAIDGYVSRHVPATAIVSADFVAKLDLRDVDAVCLTYFSSQPLAHARYFCLRLRRRWPNIPIVLVLLNAPPSISGGDPPAGVQANAVALSLGETIARVRTLMIGETPEADAPEPVPRADLERVQALAASIATQEGLREMVEHAAQRAADIFDVSFALVSLIDEHHQFAHGAAALGIRCSEGSDKAGASREFAMCGYVVNQDTPLVVPDVARDARFASNPVLREREIRFFAAAPLRDVDKFVLGALYLLDTEPRRFTDRESRLLQAIADDLVQSFHERLDIAADKPLAPVPGNASTGEPDARPAPADAAAAAAAAVATANAAALVAADVTAAAGTGENVDATAHAGADSPDASVGPPDASVGPAVAAKDASDLSG